MAVLLSSPSSITAFFTFNKPQFGPIIPPIRCSIRVSSSLPSRRFRRKNYLRQKILKTLTKPVNEGLGTKIEPNVEDFVEPVFEKSDFEVVEELETSVEVNEGGVEQLEVVGDIRGTNVVRFEGFSGRMVFKVVVSFVGLFVLQTVVSVWMLGSSDSGVNSRRLRTTEEGINGSVYAGDSVLPSVDELKIAEIRRMAREVRMTEMKEKNTEKGELDEEDISDDDEEEEDSETDNSTRSGIAKEIDGRLTMLRKRSPTSVQNVNFLKNAKDSKKEVNIESVDGTKDDSTLMVEVKRKFRSHLAERSDKPKGFEGIDDIGKKGTDVNDTVPLRDIKKRPASEEERLGKVLNGSSSLRSDSSLDNLSTRISKVAEQKRGLYQDSDSKKNLDVAAEIKESVDIEVQESLEKDNMKGSTSKIHAPPKGFGKSDSGKYKSKQSRSTNKDNKNNDDSNCWWSSLPCVFVILMQKGRGSELQQGFYTLHINSDTDYESSYTVAFEDQNDATNFSYILESIFGDVPDAAIDVVLMSTREFKEIIESVNKNVVVARKGEIKLYAGQPLDDIESALKLLVK